MKEANIGYLAVHLESSFGGSTTGLRSLLRGTTQFDYTRAMREGRKRWSVWRQQSSSPQVPSEFGISINAELVPCRGLALLVSTLLKLDAETTVAPGKQRIYSPCRMGVRSLASVKLCVAMLDGPWITVDGFRVSTLRFTVTSSELVKVAIDGVALAVSKTLSNPSWSYEEEDSNQCPSRLATVSLNSTPLLQVETVSTEFGFPLSGRGATKLGGPTKIERDGPLTITGSLTEMMQEAVDLQALVASGTEAAMAMEFQGERVSTRKVQIGLPQVVLKRADPRILGQGDAQYGCAWEALNAASLGASWPTLTVVSSS